jgi:arabinoxylan arabinofuranohydrolase
MRINQFCLLLWVQTLLLAQNPITPAGVYIADPAAHVWEDGRLYLYGSLDESTQYYCSWRHHVMVTDDLKDWEMKENVFASKGEKDQVPYSDALLFAPDCMVRNGRYYLYYCQPDPRHAEGVAVGDSPVGPFKKGRALDLGGYNQIDPNVFIDDDGQAYYVWGQFTAKMARLKHTMTELDLTTLRDSVITQEEHFFHEGPFLTKRKGIYYLIYADLSRAGRPTGIGYAMADKPMGPYRYGGMIVDNDNCDPGVWNNHGSIVEYQDQWYVFYHRSTHNSKMMRKACVESIFFNEDGTIDEVEMTSQGAGPPLAAFDTLEAERVCLIYGHARIEQFGPAAEQLGQIMNEDQAVLKYVNFKEGAGRVTARVKPGRTETTLAFKADYLWGPSIGELTIPAGNSEAEWQEITADIQAPSGVHALWLAFYSNNREYTIDCAVDWLRFYK